MNEAAIRHRSSDCQCYAADKDTVTVILQTGKDVDEVFLIWHDPFISELVRKKHWFGQKTPMKLDKELRHHFLWRLDVKPPFKRLQYYFELQSEGTPYVVYENRVCPKSEENRISKQFFKFPWINPGDIITPPDWVKNTLWYQIMPDRFCRESDSHDSEVAPWGKRFWFRWETFYGGNLKGITGKLPYLHDLGVTGVYFTPIFQAASYHRYNTFDYNLIDPLLGTEDDIRELIRTAHDLGIRVMLDGVFNHCGIEFFAWKDVLEKKQASRYYDWFFINDEDFIKPRYDTADGRFYSFSFWSGMPKLNTNNPEVIAYFTKVCSHWVKDWDIDGIRFDVGDEVSHRLIRTLHRELKPLKPDLYLLGEIWFDSLTWLDGTQYDSVMNYPFSNCINDFFRTEELDAREFMYQINYCLTLYPQQVTEVLFNFLDTHDTVRVFRSCQENVSILLQKLALLLTMPGSPCIYYGTELALKGHHPGENRECMPWNDIEKGKYDEILSSVKKLIAVRQAIPAMCSGEISFVLHEDYPRVLHYLRTDPQTHRTFGVIVNAGTKPFPFILQQSAIRYGNLFADDLLSVNGILIYENNEIKQDSSDNNGIQLSSFNQPL